MENTNRLEQPVVLKGMLGLIAVLAIHQDNIRTLDGVTFHDQPNVLYARFREVANSFGVGAGKAKGKWHLGTAPIQMVNTRRLLDGTLLFRVGALQHHGYSVRWDPDRRAAVVKLRKDPGRAIYVRKGSQRAVLNKKEMLLVGWQGREVVFRSKIGIGRAGHQTPTGIFRAQSYRTKLHRSTIYDQAPMPWSVHVVGNIFIHGSENARGRTSHGCIRLPVEGRNPARWFYSWIETGTPITILGKWPKNA